MGTDENYKTPVIWRTTYEESKKRWRIVFTLANLFYLGIIASLGFSFIHHEKTQESFALQKQELDELKTKETIYSILRNKGVSLN